MHFLRSHPVIAFLPVLLFPPTVLGAPAELDSILHRTAMRLDQLAGARQSYSLDLAVRTFIDEAVEDRFEPRRAVLATVQVRWKKGERETSKVLSQEKYSKLTALIESTESMLYLTPGPFPLIHDLRSSCIPFSGTDLAGPLAPDASQHYTFERDGTTVVDGYDAMTIRIIPNHRGAECIEGEMTIRMQDGALMKLQAGISPNVHYYPYGRRLTVRETFDPATGLVQRAEWEFEIEFPAYRTFRYVSIAEVSRQTLNAADVSNLPDTSHAGTLAEQFMARLSDYERSAVNLLLPFRNSAAGDRFWGFTVLPDPRYNRVEGGYAGGMVGFKNIAIQGVVHDLGVEGGYGYGFEDKKTKYRVDVSKGLFAGTVRIGAKYFRELKEKEQDQLFGAEANSLSALLYRYDKFHYFYVRGFEVYSRTTVRHNLTVDIRYTDRRDYSATRNTQFAFIKSLLDFDPNYSIQNGKLRRMSGGVEYQLGHGRGIRPRNAYMKVEAHAAHANNNWLKSDFDFTKLSSSARFHVPTTRRGSMDGAVYLGYTKGVLPQQYLFDLYGVVPYALRTVSLLETSEAHVQGSHLAALVLEHNFGGQLLEMTGLPWIGNGKIDLIPLVGVGFAGLSGRTKNALVAPTRTLKKPFYEAGFGIGDVFQFLRLECVWRLNQRQLGKTSFIVTVSMLFSDF